MSYLRPLPINPLPLASGQAKSPSAKFWQEVQKYWTSSRTSQSLDKPVIVSHSCLTLWHQTQKKPQSEANHKFTVI